MREIVFNKRFQYQNCTRLESPEGRRYLCPDGSITHSVTTILDQTSDKTPILEWRDKVGHQEADRITKESAGIGSLMHGFLERLVRNEEVQPGTNLIQKKSYSMAQVIMEEVYKNLDEVWCQEQNLWYPGLYSGTCDLIGIWKGNPTVIDYKQSRRFKKTEWVDSYRKQLCAYAAAHNEIYGTSISHGVILMCTQAGELQVFEVDQDWDQRMNSWWDTVDEFYSNLP